MADRHDTPSRELGKLREFSTKLAERLASASEAVDQADRLAIRIGERAYLVDMSLASEIVPLPTITSVPWTQAWYRGLINVRGRLVGVIDLDHFSDRGALSEAESQQALVFGESLGVNAALLISRAYGLRSLAGLQAIAAKDEMPWEKARWLDSDGSVLVELDLRELVRSPGFAHIGV